MPLLITNLATTNHEIDNNDTVVVVVVVVVVISSLFFCRMIIARMKPSMTNKTLDFNNVNNV